MHRKSNQHPPEATPSVADYSRQLSVEGMSAAAQKTLARSSVLAVGAGGLGVTAISYLAAAGVGAVTVLDHDTIEASNLHRQTIYTFDDIGKSKAQAATAYLQPRTAGCRLTAVQHKADLDTMQSLLSSHDLILDCTDDFACSFLINDLAWHTATPAVFANAAGMQGQLFALDPTAPDAVHARACLRCIWQTPPAGAENTCDAVGVLGPVPGILGCLQAIEAIKLLTGFQPALHNRLLNYRFDTHRLHDIRVAPRPGCQHRISSAELQQRHTMPDIGARRFTGNLTDALAQGFQVTDIRSAAEVATQPCPEATRHTPMPELLASPQQHLDAQQPCVLVCSTGRRSRSAVMQLREQYPLLFFYP